MCGFPFSLTVNTRSYNNESFVWWVHYIKESKLRFAHCHRNPISFIPIYLDGGGTFFNSLSPPLHIFYARTWLSSFNHITPQLEHSSELKASTTFHFHFINHKCVKAHIKLELVQPPVSYCRGRYLPGTAITKYTSWLNAVNVLARCVCEWEPRGASKWTCIELLLTFRLLLRTLSFGQRMHLHSVHKHFHPHTRHHKWIRLGQKSTLTSSRGLVSSVKACCGTFSPCSLPRVLKILLSDANKPI